MMFVVFLTCLVAQPSFGDEGNKVVGTWKLVSYEVEQQSSGQKGPVMGDKPATASLDEAKALARIVASTGVQYRLSYTYTGYPMVREARERVARGDIGTVRKVIVEYLQGWLGEPIELTGNKQASWRAGNSLVPDILEAVRSMAFIERAVNANRQSWVALEI